MTPQPFPPTIEEQPPYPTGQVVGACVCGSWPGGECLKCTWRPAGPVQDFDERAPWPMPAKHDVSPCLLADRVKRGVLRVVEGWRV